MMTSSEDNDTTTDKESNREDGGPYDWSQTDKASRTNNAPSQGGPDIDRTAVETYLQWGLLVAGILIALIAAVGLYGSIASIIDIWVAPPYQPFARAATNLVLLSGAIGVMLASLRRL